MRRINKLASHLFAPLLSQKMYKISIKQYSFYIQWTLLEGFLANIPILSIGLLCLKMRSIEKENKGGGGGGKERLREGHRFESLTMLRHQSWQSAI